MSKLYEITNFTFRSDYELIVELDGIGYKVSNTDVYRVFYQDIFEYFSVGNTVVATLQGRGPSITGIRNVDSPRFFGESKGLFGGKKNNESCIKTDGVVSVNLNGEYSVSNILRATYYPGFLMNYYASNLELNHHDKVTAYINSNNEIVGMECEEVPKRRGAVKISKKYGKIRGIA